jgi:hypothetical protein
MEQDSTLKNIINQGKNESSLTPEPHFIDNTRKILLNKIEQLKGLVLSEQLQPETGKQPVKSGKSNWLMQFFQNASRQKQLGYAFMAFLLILTTTLGYLSWTTRKQPTRDGKIIAYANFGTVTILPEKEDALGVDPSSAYSIETKESTSVDQLTKHLTIRPSAEFAIEKETETKFRLAFKENLQPDKVYTFTLATKDENYPDSTKELSWAFQMKNVFRVVSTLPRNKSNNVPTNSGIEITLSHENFAQTYSEYVEISPAVEGRFEQHKKTIAFIPKELKPGTLYTVKLKKELPLTKSDERLTEDYTFQFETLTGEGQIDLYSSNYVSEFGRSLSEFSPSEKPAFTVFGIPESYDSSFKINYTV